MDNPNQNAFNPYAAPAAESGIASQGQTADQQVGSYYAMSVTKLWIMSVLSFGIYNLAFFFRHWRHLRDHQQQDVSPFWRTVFAPFMYFGLNSQVGDDARFKQISAPPTLGIAAGLYFGAGAAGRLVNRVADETATWTLLVTALVIPIGAYALTVTQTAMNRILAAEGYRGPVNEGATAGSIIVGILGGVLWVFGILGSFIIG